MQNQRNEKRSRSTRKTARNEEMVRRKVEADVNDKQKDHNSDASDVPVPRDHTRGDDEVHHGSQEDESPKLIKVAKLPKKQEGETDEGEHASPKKKRHLMTEEEKREERRASNRRSALESRKRRQFLIQDLKRQVGDLTREVTELKAVNRTLLEQLDSSRAENNHLRMALPHPQTAPLVVAPQSLPLGTLGTSSVQAVLGRSGGIGGGIGSNLWAPQTLWGGNLSTDPLGTPPETHEAGLYRAISDLPAPAQHEILLQQHQQRVLGPTGRLSTPLESVSTFSTLRRATSSMSAAELAYLALKERAKRENDSGHDHLA